MCINQRFMHISSCCGLVVKSDVMFVSTHIFEDFSTYPKLSIFPQHVVGMWATCQRPGTPKLKKTTQPKSPNFVRDFGCVLLDNSNTQRKTLKIQRKKAPCISKVLMIGTNL